MVIILVRAISWFSQLIILALCIRGLLSWFGQDSYSVLGKAYRFFVKITEPIVSPCRNLLSRFNTGMFDFSVLLAFFLVEIVAKVLIRIIIMFFY